MTIEPKSIIGVDDIRGMRVECGIAGVRAGAMKIYEGQLEGFLSGSEKVRG